VILIWLMDIDSPNPADLAILRSAFETGSPLGWEAVHAFEEQHGIVLPEPYRTFVAEICDGSAFGPPDYGLMELGSLPDDWGDDRPIREMAKPFPLTEDWVWEDEDRPDEELGELLAPVYDHGSLVLGTDGCGMYWHLIVAGPHRGHIWSITGEGAIPFGAEFGYTTGRSGFAGWVQHWAEGKPWFEAA
jgi:acyl-coenzyme A synthetase/AMP-(fatty) acid ligase